MAWGDYAQAVLALIFVLGLVGILILILRHFGFGAPTPTMGQRNKRVRVAEVTALDARRRLVLVRHDQREHLILLGANGETVVESRDGPPLEDAAGSAPSARGGFAQALGRALRNAPASDGASGDDTNRKPGDATS